MVPEDLGREAAQMLLQEVEWGGVVDSTHQVRWRESGRGREGGRDGGIEGVREGRPGRGTDKQTGGGKE